MKAKNTKIVRLSDYRNKKQQSEALTVEKIKEEMNKVLGIIESKY